MMAVSSPRRFLGLALLLGRTAGVSAVRIALPLYLVVAVVAFVLFAGQGLSAVTVVHFALGSSFRRAGLLSLWSIATVPAVKALFESRDSFLLRTLPVPRWWHLSIVAIGILIAESPWLILWFKGSPLPIATWASLLAMATHAAAAAGIRTLRDLASFAGVVVAWVAPVPPFLGSSLAAMVFLVCLRAAWARAPGRNAAGHPLLPKSGPLVVLAVAIGLTLARGHRAVLVRCLLFGLAAWGAAYLTIRNNGWFDRNEATKVAMRVWLPAATACAAALAGPALRTEREARWVLRVCAVGESLCAWASALLIAAALATFGFLFAAALGVAVRLDPASRLSLALNLIAQSAILATVSSAVVRLTTAGDGRDSGRIVVAFAAIVIASMVTLAWLDEYALLLWFPVAIACMLAAGRPPRRSSRDRRQSPANV